MIYTFITEKDLDVAMKKYFREQITELDDNIHIQVTSESAAFSFIKSKLNARYDLTLLFPSIQKWSNAKNYTTGAHCWLNDKIYKAKQDNTNKSPVSNVTDWEVLDPRDQLLVVYCAVITVYMMLLSVNPRKITEELHDMYNMIVEWLDDVKEGDENPDWPLLENGSSTIQWGSDPKIDHYY